MMKKLLLIFVLLFGVPAVHGSSALTAKNKVSASAIHSAGNKDLERIKALDFKYQSAKSVSMDVERVLKLGLLQQERKSNGQLWLSSGRMRLELEGEEKSLLVVNREKFWAVTYPPPEFKEAAIQVLTGNSKSKKGRSQSLMTLVTQGGVLKHFKPTGVRTSETGDKVYFLDPKSTQDEVKRAQLVLSPDGGEIRELRFWDVRENETLFRFSSIKFGKKADDQKFSYKPPAGAEVTTL